MSIKDSVLELIEATKDLDPPTRDVALKKADWMLKRHSYQRLPKGDWWNIWLFLAGRGAGKTRTAAEITWQYAWDNPRSRCLVASPTFSDVRDVCFRGESGLINVMPLSIIDKYRESENEIQLINGSLIKGIAASEPERFRGPQWHFAWCLPKGTMILMSDGTQKPIEIVQIGDYVVTRKGAKKVIAQGLSNNPNDVVAINIGDTRLTATIDHPIMVNGSWKAMGDIQMGDFVCTIRPKESIKISDMFIDLCGSNIMEKFLMVGLFITKMKTRVTTLLKIWKLCLVQSITDCIQQVEQLQIYKKKWLQKPLSLCLQLKKGAVFNVSNLLKKIVLKFLSFVQTDVMKHGGETSLFLSQGSAWCAKQLIQPLNAFKCIVVKNVMPSPKCVPIVQTQQVVECVERFPNCPTYNLTVDGEHEYVANNILVHNCDELAAWQYLDEAWDMIQFSLRLGDRPIMVCTTTPKPKPLIIDLVNRDGEDVIVTKASTYDNLANLAPTFKNQILQYEGTLQGRQEIMAEIIDPEEGGIIKRSMFRLWDADKPLPKFEYIVQSYDVATSDKTHNDPTACTVWGVFKPLDKPMAVMLTDCWSEHMQYPDLRPKVLEEATSIYGDSDEWSSGKKVDLILVEDKSAGISLIQDLQRAGLNVRAYNPGRADKTARLNIVSPIIAKGLVYLPESDVNENQVKSWIEPFLNQVCAFPEVRNDDFLDSMTQALRILRDMGFLTVDVIVDEWEDYADGSKPQKINPYAV